MGIKMRGPAIQKTIPASRLTKFFTLHSLLIFSFAIYISYVAGNSYQHGYLAIFGFGKINFEPEFHQILYLGLLVLINIIATPLLCFVAIVACVILAMMFYDYFFSSDIFSKHLQVLKAKLINFFDMKKTVISKKYFTLVYVLVFAAIVNGILFGSLLIGATAERYGIEQAQKDIGQWNPIIKNNGFFIKNNKMMPIRDYLAYSVSEQNGTHIENGFLVEDSSDRTIFYTKDGPVVYLHNQITTLNLYHKGLITI